MQLNGIYFRAEKVAYDRMVLSFGSEAIQISTNLVYKAGFPNIRVATQ